jgi:hypothetical protein
MYREVTMIETHGSPSLTREGLGQEADCRSARKHVERMITDPKSARRLSAMLDRYFVGLTTIEHSWFVAGRVRRAVCHVAR